MRGRGFFLYPKPANFQVDKGPSFIHLAPQLRSALQLFTYASIDLCIGPPLDDEDREGALNEL
jgi:hypothetical protein